MWGYEIKVCEETKSGEMKRNIRLISDVINYRYVKHDIALKKATISSSIIRDNWNESKNPWIMGQQCGNHYLLFDASCALYLGLVSC